jgi:Signal transduction histidine kinase
LTDESLERLIAAEQDERRRLALFLHDGPVQNLSGIALMIDAALHSLRPARSTRPLGAGDGPRPPAETVRDLRNLSFGLEPVVLRDQGFGPALRELALQIGTSHRFRIDTDVDAAEELGQSAQIALYTIVRELLDQAVRAGRRRGSRSRCGAWPTAASRRRSQTTRSLSAAAAPWRESRSV